MSDYYVDAAGNNVIDAVAGSQLDYPFEWVDYLQGDAISAYDFQVIGSGATKVSQAKNGTVTTAWVEVTVPGVRIEIIADVTTSSNPARKDKQRVFINVLP